MMPSTLFGGLCIAAGIVLGSVAGACMNDNLAGVDGCPADLSMLLLKLGFIFVGLGIFSIGMTFLRVIKKEKFDVSGLCQNVCTWKTDDTKKGKTVSAIGSFFVGGGIAWLAVGSACIDGVLMGVDDCLAFGSVSVCSSVQLIVIGVLLRMWTKSMKQQQSIWHNGHFLASLGFFVGGLIQAAAGGACIENNMAGAGNCWGWGGILVVTGCTQIGFSFLMAVGCFYWVSVANNTHEKVVNVLKKCGP